MVRDALAEAGVPVVINALDNRPAASMGWVRGSIMRRCSMKRA